jgi:hypothetical protein
MFSRLDPILKTITRRTEKADTRLAIRRDESKETGRRKGAHGADEFASVPWEDTASVSTASLKTFLQSLLGDGPPAVPDAPDENRHTPTTLGARAAGAYQSMGRAVHDRNVEADPASAPAPADTASALGHDFGDADLSRIRQFVSDLIDLERRGIHELTIQRSLTFLDSVQQGILLAQTNSRPGA